MPEDGLNGEPQDDRTSPRPGRLVVVDVLRGAAVVLMVVFHLLWDLVYFGHADFDLVGDPAWRAFNRLIVAAFLLLVGVGLVLAHRRGFKRRQFVRRLLVISACALAITVASRLLFPGSFIYFGILHCIAASSVLALAFLRLPPPATALLGLGCAVAPHILSSEVFDHAWIWWLGLSPGAAPANDFVPILPWFGAVLGGMALAQIATPPVPNGARSAPVARARVMGPTAWLGRHSLAIYMIHQPLLFAALYTLSLGFGIGAPGAGAIIGPPAWDQDGFAGTCQGSCRAAMTAEAQETAEAVCTSYCRCLIDALGNDPQAREELSRWDGTPEALRETARAGPVIAACEQEAWRQAP